MMETLMKTITVSVAEGKKEFSRLIREAAERNEDIVVTKRGKPMAVIVSYGAYRRSRKAEARRKILESRAAFARAGVSAAEVFRESRNELERRG
jgi:prevent-host-death family protein